MKLNRCKEKEHTWRFKDSFKTTAYEINSTDGNTYIAYAHSFADLDILISKINIATYSRDCEDHFETRKDWTCLGNQKPFWYYGRIYKIG